MFRTQWQCDAKRSAKVRKRFPQPLPALSLSRRVRRVAYQLATKHPTLIKINRGNTDADKALRVWSFRGEDIRGHSGSTAEQKLGRTRTYAPALGMNERILHPASSNLLMRVASRRR